MISVTPPTDNLYKFMAIFGLTIIIASGLMLYTHGINAYQAKLARDEALLNCLKYDIMREASAYESIARDFENGQYPFPKSWDDLQAEVHKRNWESVDPVRWENLFKAFLEAGGKFDKSWDEIYLHIYVAGGGLIFGFLLSIIGFILWYVCVQRKQDFILHKQYLDAKPK